MGLIGMLLTAVGLAMDAFAVAACAGLAMKRVTLKQMLVYGIYFGAFQGVMPLIGYLLGAQFSDLISAYDHWIAAALLSILGIRMAVGSFKKDDGEEAAGSESLGPKKMLPLAVATSIDALAVGISFAFLQVQIGLAALVIGVVTLVLSALGVRIGHAFGTKLKSKAELAGGVILIALGVKTVLEHTGVI